MNIEKPDQSEIEAAYELAGALCSLLNPFSSCFPSDDDDDEIRYFNISNPQDCKDAILIIEEACLKMNLMKLVMCLDILCDPKNKVINPDVSILALHPRFEKIAKEG